METRQREHSGFEHTDEFRVPEVGEWFQAEEGLVPVYHTMMGCLDYSPKEGKRWILRKIPQVGNPNTKETILVLGHNVTDLQYYLSNYVQVSLDNIKRELEKLKQL